MILPQGTKLHLNPQDEFTHEPEIVSNYNESIYVTAFDTRQRLGVWMRMGNRPNEGHAEMSFCVYLPTGEVGFMHSRPKIDGNRAMDAGGLRFDVLEPFKRLRARYDGEVLLMKNPRDMAHPSSAFKRSPKVPALVELDLEGVSPMYGGEIVNEDGSPLRLDPQKATLRGHLEQHMALEGRIRIGNADFQLTGATGYRDKSWGPRHWRNFFWHRFLPVTFSRDFGVLVVIQGRPDGEAVISGHVHCDGKLEPVQDVQLQVQWHEDFTARSFAVQLRTAEHSYEMQARTLSLIPLRHKALPGADPEIFTRITEALTEYRCEGYTVLAMAEFCDTLSHGAPLSRQKGTGFG